VQQVYGLGYTSLMSGAEHQPQGSTVGHETIAQMILDLDKKAGAVKAFLQSIYDKDPNIKREDIIERYSGGNEYAKKALEGALNTIPAIQPRPLSFTNETVSTARVLFLEMMKNNTTAEIQDFFTSRIAEGTDPSILSAQYELTKEEQQTYLGASRE
jgi:hypothetical protein